MKEIEKTILILKGEGWTTKAIASYLKKTKSSIDKRIQRLVKKHNCKSILHLFNQMSKSGHI